MKKYLVTFIDFGHCDIWQCLIDEYTFEGALIAGQNQLAERYPNAVKDVYRVEIREC